MNAQNTALILIGYQNDYFSKDGILRGVLENQDRTEEVLKRTINLIDRIQDTSNDHYFDSYHLQFRLLRNFAGRWNTKCD